MSRSNPFHPGSDSEHAGRLHAAAVPRAPAAEPPDGPQPNAELPTVETVPSSIWTIAGLILMMTLLIFSGYSLIRQKRFTDSLLLELQRSEDQVRAAQREVIRGDAALRDARMDLDDLREELTELKRRKEQADAAQAALESEMRAALESKDIAISELQGRLTLTILDRILFDSGEAVIKPEGRDILLKVAAVLEQAPGRIIHVSGHTDNVPIRTPAFPSNWELSAARAIAAVRFLVEDAGVDPARLAAVAHGESDPIADNATAEGRARNRRIAIVVMPETLAFPESDLPKTSNPAASQTDFPGAP